MTSTRVRTSGGDGGVGGRSCRASAVALFRPSESLVGNVSERAGYKKCPGTRDRRRYTFSDSHVRRSKSRGRRQYAV